MKARWLVEAHKVAVLRLDRLGDMVLTLPMFPVLREAAPRAELHVIGRPYPAPVAQGLAVVDRVLTVDDARGLAQLDAHIRRERYDVMFFPQAKRHQVWTALRAGVPNRVGTSRRWFGLLYSRRVSFSRARSGRQEAENNTAMIGAVLGRPVPTVLVPPRVSPEALESVDRALAGAGLEVGAPYLIVHPGSGSTHRRWPAARFGEAAATLAREHHLQVVVTGTAGERELADAVCRVWPAARSLAGVLPLPDLCALIARCRLMLSLSTGPLHLATTYDRPVVGIFHHELLERWHPLNPRGTVVTPPPGSRTLDEVTTGQVLEAARRVLALPGAP